MANEKGEIVSSSVSIKRWMKRDFASLTSKQTISDENRRVTRCQTGLINNTGYTKFFEPDDNDDDEEVLMISKNPKPKIRKTKRIKIDFVTGYCNDDSLEVVNRNSIGFSQAKYQTTQSTDHTCDRPSLPVSSKKSCAERPRKKVQGKLTKKDLMISKNAKPKIRKTKRVKVDFVTGYWNDDSLEVVNHNSIGFSQAKYQTTQSTDHTCDRPSLPASSKKSCAECPRKSLQGKLTKKDLRLHKVVFESNLLADGTPLGYYLMGKQLLSGYKSGSGIFCYCCRKVVSPSVFEAHAGYASRRKPYLQIYTSDGISLHEWAVAIKRTWQAFKNQSDDVCSICEGVGELLCCDMCPRAFHLGCVDLPRIPEGAWYCRSCVNMLEKEKFVERNANALAAGRVAGIDPVEEVKKRCVRFVGDSERDIGGCVICRDHDFSESDFGPRTVFICHQCEKEYHVGCLKEHGMDDLQELPTGNWFCSRGCSSIHSTLQQLVNNGEQKLPHFLLSTIKEKHEDKASEVDSDLNISWRLLQGKMASEKSRNWLSGAVSVFHERFDPIGDSSKSDDDLIPFMIYGRNNRNQDFGGMYCAVLTVNSIVVSAGIFRIFGQDVAEIPLVATSKSCQGKGYFQSLFSCIENLLASVNVRDLVLPAAHEAESMWKKKFGFAKISAEHLKRCKKDHKMMTFLGTSVLHKRVAKHEL